MELIFALYVALGSGLCMYSCLERRFKHPVLASLIFGVVWGPAMVLYIVGAIVLRLSERLTGKAVWCVLLLIIPTPALAESATVTAAIRTVSDPSVLGMEDLEGGSEVYESVIWRTRNCCRFSQTDRTPPAYCTTPEMIDRIENSQACEVLR